MKDPIKYTIENINGIQKESDYFDVSDNLALIRIINKSLILKESESSPILIITDFSINGIKISYEKYLPPHWNHYSVFDLPISQFLKNTNGIKIEIKENSKIEIILFFKKSHGEFSERPLSLPYYIKIK